MNNGELNDKIAVIGLGKAGLPIAGDIRQWT